MTIRIEVEVPSGPGSLSDPTWVSFDVFGTLMRVRDGSYAAFQSILADCGGSNVDVQGFWKFWEHRNIVHYWEPYQSYRYICTLSLSETFAAYKRHGDPELIDRYFGVFSSFALYPDVERTLEQIAVSHDVAVVSNIDDDLLDRTPLSACVELRCTAEQARGCKPDGTLFEYLSSQAGSPLSELPHAGQSQYTDLVGGKPLGLTIAWINRRGVALDPSVPRPDFILDDVASLQPLLA